MTEARHETAVSAGGAHRSPVFALCHRHVDRYAALDPCAATQIGIVDHDDRLTDFSPAAAQERTDLARDTLHRLAALPIGDDADRVAAAVLAERLASAIALADAGDDLRDVNVLGCPPHAIRSTFELMPSDGPAARERVRARLAAVPGALESWCTALVEGLARGIPAARRQAMAVADQLDAFAGVGRDRGWFGGFVQSLAARQAAAPEDGGDRPDLASAAAAAEEAYARTARWLREYYAPQADPVDAVGEERYTRRARAWTGADLDLGATWAWGWAELDRITDRMRVVGEGLLPGADLLEVKRFLDSDDTMAIHGTGALLTELARLTEHATDALDGTWFDIDPRVRNCDVRLAAEGSAAAPYYVPMSEDLSRPGSTWYPTRGQQRFPRWWLVSVWYHEAVPGHHLQFGAAAVERDRLSRFQRTFGWTSGHGEGWALYAERLMDELGFLAEPGVELGYLSAQAMRAARVVVDIGLHLRLPVPPGRGGPDGRAFDAESARAFLRDRALLDDGFAASEIDRYLGLPGQAISYKVGERVWLAARADARSRLGDAFDLKDWHMHALRLGPMGLDPFAAEMAGYRVSRPSGTSRT